MLLGGCETISPRPTEQLVVAHRGASGYLPEHTLEAYTAAYFMGADYIEPDIVSTRDGVLICFHDLYLEKVTDVESVYPQRARVDGHWYAIDFDFAELDRLTVDGRDDGSWTGMRIPKLEDMLLLVKRLNAQFNKDVGVIPEIKKPVFHASEGHDIVQPTLNMLNATGWVEGKLILQCFDPATLIKIEQKHPGKYKLLQCVSNFDDVPTLLDIAKYAYGIGPNRKLILDDPGIVSQAQSLGLAVIPYTFLDELELSQTFFEEYQVDGIFSNYTDIAIEARDRYNKLGESTV